LSSLDFTLRWWDNPPTTNGPGEGARHCDTCVEKSSFKKASAMTLGDEERRCIEEEKRLGAFGRAKADAATRQQLLAETARIATAEKKKPGDKRLKSCLDCSVTWVIITILIAVISSLGATVTNATPSMDASGAPASAAADGVVQELKSKLEGTVVGVTDCTFHETSTVPLLGQEYRFTAVKRYKGDKYRIESDGNVIIFDGRDLWESNSGKMRKMPHPAVNPDPGYPYWWRKMPIAAHITGTETIGDRACFIITFRDTEDFPITMWVDKENNRLLRERRGSKNDNGTFDFSEYKTIKDTFQVAYKVVFRLYRDGTPSEVSHVSEVTTVEINSGIPDSIFDPQSVR